LTFDLEKLWASSSYYGDQVYQVAWSWSLQFIAYKVRIDRRTTLYHNMSCV
jgi:hypothetical protein